MTPAARLSAAIEVIDTIEAQRAPAAKALKDWGTSHRFAGSGDRAAIAGLVWDVLRRRASSAWVMDDDAPRSRVLGMLKVERGLDAGAISALCDGGRFAPEPLTEPDFAASRQRQVERVGRLVAMSPVAQGDAINARLLAAADQFVVARPSVAEVLPPGAAGRTGSPPGRASTRGWWSRRRRCRSAYRRRRSHA